MGKAPIRKNEKHDNKIENYKGEIPIEKNVIVIDEFEKQIGTTYPKRAMGLVKKGRAVFVNDNKIRLSTPCPTDKLEDDIMENRLYFNAREWKFNPEFSSNKGERSFITGVDGELAEAFTIGSWGTNRDWTEIISKPLILEKNTKYTFTFWLNGGENDRGGDEVCQLHILFNNDKDNALVFKLNRNFIKPYKRHKGWNLYEIPFVTGDNEYTQLKFVAYNAYTTILNAKEKEAYADLEEVLDEFEGLRPQRHNIVWADGWPTNNWYSTKTLKERHYATESQSFGKMNVDGSMHPPFGIKGSENNIQHVFEKMDFEKMDFENIMDDLRDDIMDQIDVDGITEQITEQIKEQLKLDIRNNFSGKFEI